jgi:hypothetical protein
VKERDLADKIVRNPDWYGIDVFIQNPCCYADTVEVAFHNSPLAVNYEATEAIDRLEAITEAVKRLVDNALVDPLPAYRQGPCAGCFRTGAIDPRWLEARDITICEGDPEKRIYRNGKWCSVEDIFTDIV